MKDIATIIHRINAARADIESVCEKPQFGGTKEQLRNALAHLAAADCAAQRLSLASQVESGA